jgi:hypothetical protein
VAAAVFAFIADFAKVPVFKRLGIEAEAISGVEDAPDPDVAEVHTKQVPEDDVPGEYLDQD